LQVSASALESEVSCDLGLVTPHSVGSQYKHAVEKVGIYYFLEAVYFSVVVVVLWVLASSAGSCIVVPPCFLFAGSPSWTTIARESRF
jgi:hypothetical protein